MIRTLPSFSIDYMQERELILPFYTLPPSSKVYEDGKGDIFIRAHSYLFVLSERSDADISPFLNDKGILHFLYPVDEEDGDIRYLMHKREGNSQPTDKSIAEIAAFYENSEFPEADEEYLLEHKRMGELLFTECDEEGVIVSAACTSKNRQTLVNLTTREEYRGKGHATALLKKTPAVYLFCETAPLRHFYEERGFECVRRYKSMSRRSEP